MQLWKDMEERGVDPHPLLDALKQATSSGQNLLTVKSLVDEIAARCSIERPFVDRFAAAISDTLDRSVRWFQVEEVNTSWAIPLGALFNAENIPPDPDTYLDQRYIDFLAKNSEDLHRIHWRNFERLTAEFFRVKGFRVELGPGGDDGGIDIRVWNEGADKSGPPLLVIQCKRYKDTNDVEIETVKAFWTDVL